MSPLSTTKVVLATETSISDVCALTGSVMQIWQVTPKTKPKTYTFYYEAGGIAAARSSAGGLALLRK